LQHLLHRTRHRDSVKITLKLIEMPVCRAIEIGTNRTANFASGALRY